MSVRRSCVLAVLFATLVAGGCAGAGDGSAESPAGGPAPASPAASSPGASSPGAPPSESKPGAAGTQTISGTVTAGVEPNCLLLTGEDDLHLLVFKDEKLRSQAQVGSRITVTGRAEPAMLSTCQQGIPFIVASVRAS
jgi:hypothetical protein